MHSGHVICTNVLCVVGLAPVHKWQAVDCPQGLVLALERTSWLDRYQGLILVLHLSLWTLALVSWLHQVLKSVP